MQAKVKICQRVSDISFTNPLLLYVFVWYFAGPAVKEYEQLPEATITCMLKMEKFIVIIFARPSIL
jgi:hypothetical protein